MSSVRRMTAALALLVVAMSACTSEGGVPSPKSVELSDGTLGWRIEAATCSEDSSCGLGVYINRWYYGISCLSGTVEASDLGRTFAVGGDDELASEARRINDEPATTLALLVEQPDCPGWIRSDGVFDDYGLDDPPVNPTQAPPDD